MRKIKILHIAPINTSNVPGAFVQAERQMGFDSNLVTLFRDARNYGDDLCLDLPFIDFIGTRWIKKVVSNPSKLVITNRIAEPHQVPLQWQPHSLAEKWLVSSRDRIWKSKVERAIREHGLDQYDIYQLDGGLGFYRNSAFIQKMHSRGKKIICCYTGSDLRTRGVIPTIDNTSDLNVTVEFDHLKLHPNIHHVFFPFEDQKYTPKEFKPNKVLRIGHAPTNRQAKGSDDIIPIVQKLTKIFSIELELIQNQTHQQAIERKRSCDIFIDQIGDLGYGINSLESLAMGIPTCSCLADGFEKLYPDHPFVVIDAMNLEEQLVRLITDDSLRSKFAEKGPPWIKSKHTAEQSVQTIHRLAGLITAETK